MHRLERMKVLIKTILITELVSKVSIGMIISCIQMKVIGILKIA